MHDYLRAVGFSKVQHKRDLQRLLDMVMGEALTVNLLQIAAARSMQRSVEILCQMQASRCVVK